MPFISTPLQRGDTEMAKARNRFSGLAQRRKTAKAVHPNSVLAITPLKRGVNENRIHGLFAALEPIAPYARCVRRITLVVNNENPITDRKKMMSRESATPR